MSDHSDPQRIHACMSGSDRSARARAFRCVASLIEPIYTAAVNRRNRKFDAGLNVQHATLPVISIGNLTTGGTGKTPMAIFVIDRLMAMGHRPAVLTRGYKAATDGDSDEATLLAGRMPTVPIIINPDRVAGAAEVATHHPQVDVLVMDDGFQHRRLARDVDLVLIDATCPFGYGHVLPRGMLREPVESLRRTTAVIVTHAERMDDEAMAQLDQQIAQRHGKPPIAHMAHGWEKIVDADGQTVDTTGRRVMACCGIGNPRPFYDEAARHATVAAHWTLDDHHGYSAEDVAKLDAMLKAHQAHAILTTEKDWTKLRYLANGAASLPIWRSVLRMQPCEMPDVLDAVLRSAFG